jgi:hypothetical protein
MATMFTALSLTYSNLRNNLIDWYLTKRTGKDKATREWEAWYEANVVYRATTIENMFMHFKHVIEVDVQKFTDPYEPMAWVPCADARQYFWPQRELGNNAVWRFERVYWNEWEKRWHINDMGDADKIFVATNNDRDAMMISLKYL